MRAALRLALFAVLALLPAAPALAGDGVWTFVGPPPAQEPDDLVLDPHDPSTLYAVYGTGDAPSGLWKSTDGGLTWTSIQPGLPSPFVLSLVVDPFTPGTLFVLSGGTLQRSADGGRTWAEVSRGEPGAVFFGSVVPDPVIPGVLWAVPAFGGGLSRSDDGGATFARVGAAELGGGTLFPSNLTFDPQRPEVLYHADGQALWRSADRGVTWAAAGRFESQGFEWIRIAPSRTSTIYARPVFVFGQTPWCVRSDDGGATWAPLPFPTPLPSELCSNLVVDPQDHLRIWALSSERRLLASRDGGATWTVVREQAPSLPGVFSHLLLEPASGTLFTAPTEGGIFRSADRGATWQASRRGPGQAIVESFLAVPGPGAGPALLAGRRFVSLVRSRNDGRAWAPLPFENVWALAADPNDPAHIFAGGFPPGTTQTPLVLESRDAGASWKVLASPPVGAITRLAVHPFRPEILYLGTLTAGIWRSRDGGRTWTSASAGLPFGPPCDQTFCPFFTVTDLLIDPRDPRVLWTVFDGKVMQSADAGRSWTRVAGLRQVAGRALSFDPRRRVLYVAGLGSLWKSADGGATWTEIGRDLLAGTPDERLFQEILVDPATGTLWVGTQLRGVFRSLDGGATWEPFSEGLPELPVVALELDPTRPGGLFAVLRGGGIWSRR